MQKVILVTVAAMLAGAFAFSQPSQPHELKLLPQNVHWGYYDATIKPVLHVASGATIRVDTMVAIEFAASCRPLRKSNASATIIRLIKTGRLRIASITQCTRQS